VCDSGTCIRLTFISFPPRSIFITTQTVERHGLLRPVAWFAPRDANGKTTPQACKEAEITAQTYYRWRKEFGGLKLDQAKRLKELERENAKLKRLVAELSLEKQILKDVAEGNF
jgi:putative transposase